MTTRLSGRGFSSRVALLLATQVIGVGLGIFNGLLLARLLGPAAKGDYYLITLLPSTIMVLIQFGMPQALGYFAARGQTLRLLPLALALASVVSAGAMVVTIVILPMLRTTVIRGPELSLVLVGLATIPLALNATFMTGIVLGRQAVRVNLAVNVSTSILTTLLLIVLVALLGLGLRGAVIALFAFTAVQSVGFLFGAIKVTRVIHDATRVSLQRLLAYGLPLYPGSVTQFFSYRFDVYLIAWLLPDPAAPLGYYSMAVTLAEMAFFLPNAVGTLFFPQVAGSPRSDADRQVALVSRITLMTTALAAVLVIPLALVLVTAFLPAFTPALPPLFVLLPGVVALSVSRVLSGYAAGVGRTGITSALYVAPFLLNVALNLLLIPSFGIVGAAAASLVSYTSTSIAFTLVASVLSGTGFLAFWVPRGSDLRIIVAGVTSVRARIQRRQATGV